MKFLCLTYGHEKDWVVLSEAEQAEFLAADEVLLKRGDTLAAVGPPTSVRAWDGEATTSEGSFVEESIPLAGFSIIEADTVDEVVQLVSGTPCARAKGAVVVRPIVE